jgi:hypothetical protein
VNIDIADQLLKADFARRTKGFTYKSPIPDLIKEPVGLPDKMRSYGSVLDLRRSSSRPHTINSRRHTVTITSEERPGSFRDENARMKYCTEWFKSVLAAIPIIALV